MNDNIKKNNYLPSGTAALAAIAAVSSAGMASVQEYAKGNGALEDFSGAGFAASPQWVQIWVFFMIAVFAIGLFVFAWRQPIARRAAGGFLLAAVFANVAFPALGLPPLSGSLAISHLIFWTPALVLLLKRRPFSNPAEGRWFRIWSGVITFVIVTSFVFDIRDAFIYIRHFSGVA